MVVLFAASAAIRFGDGIGLLARAADGANPEADIASADGPTPEHERDPALWAAALTAREARAAVQEEALAEKAAALILSQQALAKQLTALETMEQELSALVAMADRAAEGDLTRLTAVYEAMKPRDAAPLFEQMAPDFAAGFLGRMRAEAAAGILAGMGSEKAYAVSAVLAGRNANAPKD